LGREVRILESRFEFEAIAKYAISSDVTNPNDGDEERQSDVGPEPENTKRKWERVCMNDVVTETAEPLACEIPNHG
jgi:hypothetical protein